MPITIQNNIPKVKITYVIKDLEPIIRITSDTELEIDTIATKTTNSVLYPGDTFSLNLNDIKASNSKELLDKIDKRDIVQYLLDNPA